MRNKECGISGSENTCVSAEAHTWERYFSLTSFLSCVGCVTKSILPTDMN